MNNAAVFLVRTDMGRADIACDAGADGAAGQIQTTRLGAAGKPLDGLLDEGVSHPVLVLKQPEIHARTIVEGRILGRYHFGGDIRDASPGSD